MSTRRLLARPVFTAGATDPPEITQKFSPGASTILLAARVVIIKYNSPTFTSIQMKLYADRGGSAGSVIATSTNSKVPADIATLAHAFKETFFTFNKIPLRADSTYHFGLIFNGYTGNSSSHLAWAMSWPDPPYRTGLTINQAKAGNMPLALTVIESEV